MTTQPIPPAERGRLTLFELIDEAETLLNVNGVTEATDECGQDLNALTLLHERLEFVASQIRDVALPLVNAEMQKWATSKWTQTEAGRVRVTNVPKGKKVDGERLLAHVVSRALDERVPDEDGTFPEREGEAVARVLARVSPITNPSHQWRKTALTAMGIDIHDFETVTSWETKAVVDDVLPGQPVPPWAQDGAA